MRTRGPIIIEGQGGGQSVGLIGGAGKSGDPAVTSVADSKFLSYYLKNTATSGDNRGLYLRHYFAGAGGGGEAARIFSSVEDVVAGTVHGAHISLGFESTGKVSGLGAAMRATLHIANQATQGGTMAAIMAEIWSDGATSDPSGSQLSALRVVNGGNATGMADVDDDAYLFDFAGWTVASGNMLAASTTEANYSHSAKCRLPDGTVVYLMFASAEG